GPRRRSATEPGRGARWLRARGLPRSSSILGVDGDDAAGFERLLPFPLPDDEAPLLGRLSHRDVEPGDVAHRAERHQVPCLVLDEIDGSVGIGGVGDAEMPWLWEIGRA